MIPSRQTSALIVLLALTLAGCGGARVQLHNPTIPAPLIDQLPLVVAARYPEVFDHFVDEEQIIGKEKWLIDLGQSNRLLFNQLFDAMFSDFTVLEEGVDARDVPFDALIEPSIDAFEFSVPSQSLTEDFAVWIRYGIMLFDKDGTEIAHWPVAADGKSLATWVGGDEALQRAAILAMRDAAALIILQMDKATGISSLSEARARQTPPQDPPAQNQMNLQFTASEEPPR